MLDKELGKDIAIEERENFLRDNCDAVEEVTYSKMFTSEELAKQRETLTEVSIKIADIEEEKKQVIDNYREQLKPLQVEKAEAISNLKSKSQVVTEDCFKFLDEESRMVGFYNKEGILVNSRPAFPNELQKTMFSVLRKTGTDD